MGQQEGFQPKLFYHQINLKQRVPPEQTPREIQKKIDFDFVHGELGSANWGQVSEYHFLPAAAFVITLLMLTQ
jgi:hypothetical protein